MVGGTGNLGSYVFSVYGRIYLVHLRICKYFTDNSSVNFHDKFFLHFLLKFSKKWRKNLSWKFTDESSIKYLRIRNWTRWINSALANSTNIFLCTNCFENELYCFFRFGVCCVFLYSSTSNTISYNDSYIQNPGFPSAYTSTGTTVTYTIQKCSNGMRL